MKIIEDIDTARQYIRDGLIIAYPTEAVYGLGCDPFNDNAVKRLLEIKQRPQEKGLILIISCWQQLNYLIAIDEVIDFSKVNETWPGHTTWLFPKSEKISEYVSGVHDSIAIRMTAHKIASKLAKDTPLVSTSANITSLEPARSISEVEQQFAGSIDGIVVGSLGNSAQPSSIYDVVTGKRLR